MVFSHFVFVTFVR